MNCRNCGAEYDGLDKCSCGGVDSTVRRVRVRQRTSSLPDLVKEAASLNYERVSAKWMVENAEKCVGKFAIGYPHSVVKIKGVSFTRLIVEGIAGTKIGDFDVSIDAVQNGVYLFDSVEGIAIFLLEKGTES